MADTAPPFPECWAGFRAEHRHPKTAFGEYVVVGPHAVMGVTKGGTVRLELTPGQTSALIEAGHIVPADSGRSPENQEEG